MPGLELVPASACYSWLSSHFCSTDGGAETAPAASPSCQRQHMLHQQGGRRRRHHPQPQWSKPLIRRRATCTTSTQAAAWATAANTGQGRATRPIGMTGSNTRRWDRPHPRSRPRIPWCQGGSRWTVGMPGQNYRATGIKIVAKCRTVPSFPSWEWTQMILDINNHSS